MSRKVSITIRYGAEELVKQVDENTAVSTILKNKTFQTVLGFWGYTVKKEVQPNELK